MTIDESANEALDDRMIDELVEDYEQAWALPVSAQGTAPVVATESIGLVSVDTAPTPTWRRANLSEIWTWIGVGVASMLIVECVLAVVVATIWGGLQ